MNAIELGVEQLDDSWIILGRKTFGDGLRLLTHAGKFGLRYFVDLHAPGSEIRYRLLGLIAADPALVVACLNGGLPHDLLLRRRELVPELPAHQDDVGAVGVVRDAEILLDLVELVRKDHQKRVLLAINSSGFQGSVKLAEAHGHRVGAERLEGFQVDRIWDDPDFDPAEILAPGDWTPAVRYVSEAQIPVAKANQALLRQLFQESRSKRPIE